MLRTIDRVGEREVPCWLTGADHMGLPQCVPDFGDRPLTQEDLAITQRRPVQVDRKETFLRNVMRHKEFMGEHTSLARELGSKRGKTAVLVGSGPSASQVAELDAIDADVWGLNLGIRIAQKHLSGVFLFERLAKDWWWKGARTAEGDVPDIDPASVMLVTSPIARGSLVDHWGASGNLRYAFTWECGHIDGDFYDFPALSSALTSAVIALHALVEMGYEKIVVVGFDFACKRGEDNSVVFYADGTTYAESYYGEPLFRVFGSNGESWATNGSLLSHALAFEAACRSTIKRGVDFVNSSGGILPFNYTPLASVLKE